MDLAISARLSACQPVIRQPRSEVVRLTLVSENTYSSWWYAGPWSGTSEDYLDPDTNSYPIP